MKKMNVLNKALAAAVLVLTTAVVFAAGAKLTQETFASPEAASKALAAAARADDEKALAQILGSSGQELSSDDAATDKAALKDFVAKYERMNRWTAMTDGSRMLWIGADNYPFPIPLVSDGTAWHFDAASGAQEIALRRIGANELLAIDAIDAIGNAEEAYRDGQAQEYARLVVSSDGKHDGLYWNAVASDTPSPLAALGAIVTATSALREPLVIDGYTFRILDAQGDNAIGGASSYVKDGKMSEGFAVVASPLDYGHTGVRSFMLSRDGVVYEKDLGDDTAEIAANIDEYNPGAGWTLID
jgi:hypothetical protein